MRAAAGGSPLDPPKSASEVKFDIADPPLLPVCPPSTASVLESATLMTENDVLCGRGGGTNSQMGNRRFRALVRDFQPTYLMAKRREKPRMARSVVLIVRNRGGRFLRRVESDGRLFEVGDEKAEAKTSQALREGLDVRATKTAANTLMGTSIETVSGGSGKKRKQGSPPTSAEKGADKLNRGDGKAMGEGSRVRAKKRELPARPQPVHAPGKPQSRHLPPPTGGGHPSNRPGPAPYYSPYPPRYDDSYHRSRYPPNVPPSYSHPPPSPAAHHHQYRTGGGGHPYPTSYIGYQGATAAATVATGAYPSPSRSSRENSSQAGNDPRGDPRGSAAFSPPRVNGPNLTPIASRRKVLQ